MPWLPLYADEADLADVVRWLSEDEEIAFVVSAGPKRWIAHRALEGVHFNRIALWHIPSGPLPLIAGRAWQRHRWIEDPMQGWKERRTGLDPTVPFFGAGHPGIVWFNAETAGPDGEEIGMSGFEWIGNRYRLEGLSASPETERWWDRLRAHIRSIGVRVPRLGPLDGPDPEIWALPGALLRLRSGAIRAINP